MGLVSQGSVGLYITEIVSKGRRSQASRSILLRQSGRVGSKVKSKTLAVLTHLPAHVVAAVRRAIAQPAESLQQLAQGSEGTLKTGHLHLRPWFGCALDNTQAHALTAMLALKVRRHLERAWRGLDLTVEEGLRQLERLCVMDLIDWASGRVLARQLPQLNALQQQPLEALGLSLPSTVPEARVSVVRRKKISLGRKPIEK